MYTDQDLLKLAGKLALSCEAVLKSHPLTLSTRLKIMEQCLNEYNNTVIEATEERKVDK